MSNWICDGVPKDGQQYPQAMQGGHPPYENSSPDCLICGLPREAMKKGSFTPPTTPPTTPSHTVLVGNPKPGNGNILIPAIVIGSLLAAGLGWGLYNFFGPKPDNKQVVTTAPASTPSATSNAPAPNAAVFVGAAAKNPQLYSQGEKILINPTPEKEKGAAAFAKEDWQGAVSAYEPVATAAANDPEGKIYYNNAQARLAGNPLQVAVVVPITNDPNSAKEVLRGVARYQEEFNASKPQRLLEIVIANDGGQNQSIEIADDLVNSTNVLGVLGHGIDQTSQQAMGVYEKAGLAVLSPLTTSVEGTNLKSIPLKESANELLGSYLTAVGRTLANYANSQKSPTKAAIFYNSSSGYSSGLKDSFAQGLDKVKGTVVTEVDTSAGNFDAKAAVEKAKQEGANVVFLALSKDAGSIEQAVNIAKASDSLLLLGGNELYTPNILIQGRDAIRGLILAVPWSFQPNDPFAQDALNSWKGRVSWRTATAYDAAKVLGGVVAKSSDRSGVTTSLNQGVSIQGSTTGFNVFNDVPLVKANPGNDGPPGSKYQFDPIE
ncbi:MAG: hypothetical protein N5P05_000267 [Chroococcopsis gigantea SAG 12.99]|jgi:branched-chain amino acid transport system substrate-binding protein|nr:hypothetical protein [Chroococcopsis gigantea SAG 12.99]